MSAAPRPVKRRGLALISASVLCHPLLDALALHDALRDCSQRTGIGIVAVGAREHLDPPEDVVTPTPADELLAQFGGRALPWLFSPLRVRSISNLDSLADGLPRALDRMRDRLDRNLRAHGRPETAATLHRGLSFTHTARLPGLESWGLSVGTGVQQLPLGLDIPPDEVTLARAVVGAADVAADILF